MHEWFELDVLGHREALKHCHRLTHAHMEPTKHLTLNLTGFDSQRPLFLKNRYLTLTLTLSLSLSLSSGPEA